MCCHPEGGIEKKRPGVIAVLAAALRRPQNLCAHYWKTLNALLCCRTPVLGLHHYRCSDCGRSHYVPHSCRNRHCPDCQGANAREWLERQEDNLLKVPYFHVVFTLPHDLNPLIAQNQKALLGLLFSCVSATLLEFSQNKLGIRPGITTVLHTWGQNLLGHYHLHGIVTGGGLTADGEHQRDSAILVGQVEGVAGRQPKRSGETWKSFHPRYLLPVRALSIVFRAKYRDGLLSLYRKGDLEFHGNLRAVAGPVAFARLVHKACRQKWNVYAKRPFGGPRQVLGYLSRYTHRIAIGNHRILALDRTARTVTFAYKDYAQDAKRKTMTLHLDEFLRRFCLHILPPRFVKIRHYGLLANRGRDSRIEQARKLLADQETRPAETSSAEVVPEKRPCPQLTCPHCGSLRLLLVDIIQPQHPHGTAPPYPDTS